jgi:hypothetical protein
MKNANQMGEMDPQLSRTLGVVAVVLLALGVGLIGGYVLFGKHGERAPAAVSVPPPAGVPGASAPALAGGQPSGLPAVCPYELPAKDQPSLAGLHCNCGQEHCNNLKLLHCHCETAHAMKEYVKELLAKGVKPEPKTVGAELEKRWGKGILPQD